MASGQQREYEKIRFRMHPRVFAALGADLVTNDVVAVIELVKNSYDALATKVWIRFLTSPTEGVYLEIADDGEGMSESTIKDVWCLVATPYKEENPYIGSGDKQRRVAGEKGLGRLSVARLGERLRMQTQAPGKPCWEVEVDWKDIAASKDLSTCYAKYRRCIGKSPFQSSGTKLQVFGLKGIWDTARVTDLEDNLARLVSPFVDVGQFNIYLTAPGMEKVDPVRIESPEFLSKPKYCIEGLVDKKGRIKATYRFAPMSEGQSRVKKLDYTWEQVYDTIQDQTRFPYSPKEVHCGPFSFEVRAWDIAPEDTQEISERFEFQKSKVRKTIRVHKGISVYRDGILVLPKSENARDWLGLDLRRISRVGSRLSTSQVVGYVAISADDNPAIEDTSDRERLAAGRPVAEFEELLKSIVALLENERDIDKLKVERKKPLEDLFGQLSAKNLLAEVEELAAEDASGSDAIQAVRRFSTELDSARKTIQERFVYYSRLATVGTIAQMLVHEIRNRTTAFGSFMSFVQARFGPFQDKGLSVTYQYARDAIVTLERLADTFAPLASRNFRRRDRSAVLEDRIRTCLALQQAEIKHKNIAAEVPSSETHVAVDPGELDAILLNLIMNAVYWLGQQQDASRKIQFRVARISVATRVIVSIHDNGPGLADEDREKVFVPGFTRKPGGIGMGLTVASELVAEYGGHMRNDKMPLLGGASFSFDIPLKN